MQCRWEGKNALGIDIMRMGDTQSGWCYLTNCSTWFQLNFDTKIAAVFNIEGERERQRERERDTEIEWQRERVIQR